MPGNPLLAESLYLAEYIERMGTGTLVMIRQCVEAGLPEPEFTVTDGFVTTVRRKALAGQVTGQVTGHRVRRLEQDERLHLAGDVDPQAGVLLAERSPGKSRPLRWRATPKETTSTDRSRFHSWVNEVSCKN